MRGRFVLLEWLKPYWYDFWYYIIWGIGTYGFSLRTEGSRNMPRSGPVLVIANHQSFLDPVLVGLAVPARRLNFLARKTLFSVPVIGKFIASVGSFPVDQEGIGKEGMKTTLDLLEQGRTVLVFPEGTRTGDGLIQDLKPGITLLIKRARVPILPVGVAGPYEMLPKGQKLPNFVPLLLPIHKLKGIAISVGKPINDSIFQSMDREEILGVLRKALLDQKERAEALRRSH